MRENRQLYDNYKKEMSRALNTDEKEAANEVIQRYKQDSKKSLEELYPQALALYKVVYDYAIKHNQVRNCGFVWKVAGPVLCRFYLKKMEECVHSLVSMLKELWG